MAESHRGPASSRSGLSSFQAFPAVHEDEFRTRYEKRYSYDFTQFKKKKRNRRLKEASQDNNASTNAVQRETGRFANGRLLNVCELTSTCLRTDQRRLRNDRWRNDSLAKRPTFHLIHA